MSSLRLTLRRLATEPAFTTTVLLTLALCIAANVAIFAVGAQLLLIGLVLGLLGAWAAGRAMQTVVFGVGTMHPGVLAATATIMTAIVLSAVLLPSRRASRIDPSEALRAE
jgi:ABC-type antimicrobial peptide transport system permease subunit